MVKVGKFGRWPSVDKWVGGEVGQVNRFGRRTIGHVGKLDKWEWDGHMMGQGRETPAC